MLGEDKGKEKNIRREAVEWVNDNWALESNDWFENKKRKGKYFYEQSLFNKSQWLLQTSEALLYAAETRKTVHKRKNGNLGFQLDVGS